MTRLRRTLTPAVLCLASVLLCPRPGLGQNEAALYDYKAAPLSAEQDSLLRAHRYEFKDDGRIIDPSSAKPVPRAELPYLIERLESGQRLQALLKLNIILANSKGEKHLTDEEKESIRKIVRENWRLFNLNTRKDFRGYFSLEELEGLNRIPLPPPPTRGAGLDLKDHAHMPAPTAAPPAIMLPATVQEALAHAPAAAAPTAPAPVPAEAPPAPVPAAPPRPAFVSGPPTAPTPSTSTLGTLQPWAPGQTMELPEPEAQNPVIIGSTAAVAAPEEPPAETLAVSTPTAPAAEPAQAEVSTATVETQATAEAEPPAVDPSTAAAEAPAAEPPPAAPEPERFKPVTREEFERWLGEAPYGREAKGLLRLISAKAPDFIRLRLLSDVVARMPQVVFDPARAGSSLDGAIIEEPGRPALIALHEGYRAEERRKMVFTSSLALYPLAGEAPPENRRVRFSPEQEAGTLLAALTRLDARWRAWDGSPLAVETVARTAQYLFYETVRRELRGKEFLDPETRRAFFSWLERPEEYRGLLVRSLGPDLDAPQEDRQGLAEAAVNEALEAERRLRRERTHGK